MTATPTDGLARMTELEWTTAADTTSLGEAASGSAPIDVVSQPRGPGDGARLPGKGRIRWRFSLRQTAFLSGATIAGLLLRSSVAPFQPATSVAIPSSSTPSPAAAAAAVVSLPPPDLLKPLSPEEAAKENSERPFVSRPDTPASKFVLHGRAEDRERALNCLAQAVYYEAASEGVDGGRAVAQVVLNRMRHPGYPASICGVVYQGADRTTGCQFTFTCDGSLLRTPLASLWARSRKIAEDALSGRVYAPIGHATHYHADYVLPYWADSLDKTAQIGRHIFYRLRSTMGDPRSFFQRYAGVEPSPPRPAAALIIPPGAVTDELANALISDDISSHADEVEKASPPSSPLLIDSTRGTLLAGENADAARPAKKPKATSECPSAADRKQIAPIGANDLNASRAASC